MQGLLVVSSRPCQLHRELHASFPQRQGPNKRRCLATVCQAATVEFSKYQGLGNDFILVTHRLRRELHDNLASW